MTPLAWYRRTGADPPFGDPRRAHGTRFEGYYWRLTDAAAGRVAIVLCGVCRDAAGPWAVVALAAQPGGLVRSRIEPLARGVVRACSACAAGVVLRGSADAAARRPRAGRAARRRASRTAVVAAARLRRDRGRRRSSPGCRSTGIRTCSAARVDGGRAGERRRRRRCYAEKNWGPRFTEHWWWGQAQGFAGADACVAFAGGARRWAARRRGRRAGRGPRAAPGAAVRARAARGGRGRLAGPRPLRALVGRDRGRGRGRAGGPAGPGARASGEVEPRSQQYLAGRLRATSAAAGGGSVFAAESSAGAGLRARGACRQRASARRAATVSGSAPTSRSNGPITRPQRLQPQPRRARRPGRRAPRRPASRGRPRPARPSARTATRTVPALVPGAEVVRRRRARG